MSLSKATLKPKNNDRIGNLSSPFSGMCFHFRFFAQFGAESLLMANQLVELILSIAQRHINLLTVESAK